MATAGPRPVVEIPGLQQWIRDLRATDKAIVKEFQQAEKEIVEDVAGTARRIASGMDNLRAEAAQAIRSYVAGSKASVGINTAVRRFGNVAFWGAGRRTGWYSAPRYQGSAARRALISATGGRIRAKGGRQHPPWVGNSWKPGDPSGGPYAINPAVWQHLPDIHERMGQAVTAASAKAFPD